MTVPPGRSEFQKVVRFVALTRRRLTDLTDPTPSRTIRHLPRWGECDSAYCDDRRDFQVTFMVFYDVTVKAHSEDEATELGPHRPPADGDVEFDRRTCGRETRGAGFPDHVNWVVNDPRKRPS